MFGPKTYYYLVDRLDPASAVTLKKALGAVPGIRNVSVRTREGVVEVSANRDVEEDLKMACTIAGLVYRTKISGKNLNLYKPIGFEPMHKGFADLSLTTWVRRRNSYTLAKRTFSQGRLYLTVSVTRFPVHHRHRKHLSADVY